MHGTCRTVRRPCIVRRGRWRRVVRRAICCAASSRWKWFHSVQVIRFVVVDSDPDRPQGELLRIRRRTQESGLVVVLSAMNRVEVDRERRAAFGSLVGSRFMSPHQMVERDSHPRERRGLSPGGGAISARAGGTQTSPVNLSDRASILRLRTKHPALAGYGGRADRISRIAHGSNASFDLRLR